MTPRVGEPGFFDGLGRYTLRKPSRRWAPSPIYRRMPVPAAGGARRFAMKSPDFMLPVRHAARADITPLHYIAAFSTKWSMMLPTGWFLGHRVSQDFLGHGKAAFSLCNYCLLTPYFGHLSAAAEAAIQYAELGSASGRYQRAYEPGARKYSRTCSARVERYFPPLGLRPKSANNTLMTLLYFPHEACRRRYRAARR